ncbi:MAG: hypothetical protein ACE5HN_01075 [Nitrospiria bacterium]
MSVAYINPKDSLITATSSSYGISDESNRLQGSIKNIRRHHWETASGQQRYQVHSSLLDVLVDCREGGWDGYGAKPLSDKAYFEAVKLLDLLPSYLALPEVVPEPTGDIALEWYKENKFTFVLSVSGNNTITYAGIFGAGNEIHGTENFTESIPRVIIENIQRLFLLEA